MAKTMLGVVKEYVGKKAYMTMQRVRKTHTNQTLLRRPESAGIEVAVFTIDVRNVHGDIQTLVTPLAGLGSCWVSARRLRIVKEWEHQEDMESNPYDELIAPQAGSPADEAAERHSDSAGGREDEAAD